MNTTITERIYKLRLLMEREALDAYLILSDDFHASEYVDDYFKCRAYMSGFTGSAGTLLIIKEEAALWTDGRYFLQAADQLAGTGITLMKAGEPGVPTIFEFLAEKMPAGGALGFDGRCVNMSYVDDLREALADKQVRLKETLDLVGEIWTDRPAFPASRIWELSEEFTGETREERLAGIRRDMRENGANELLLASLDDIAWLFMLRGSDVAYNPVFMSYARIREEDAILYCNTDAMSPELKEKLEKMSYKLRPYSSVYGEIRCLEETRLWVDPDSVNAALFACIPEGVKVIREKNPTEIRKAVKTKTEMENIRKAHIADGVAVTRLLYYLANVRETEEFKEGKVTELSVAEKLLELRREQEGFLDLSFESIIATGPHGAIIHYAPTEESSCPIKDNTFLLMDTGAQYLTGTTDITRTVAIGQVSEEQKRHYTAVLRGNLNLAAARFKKGSTGVNLDAIARMPLWEQGLDFNHGTGHGVGFLLNVHEGPQGIRMRERNGKIGKAFVPGMLTSNEPGLYLEGKYGIRLENLMLCLEDQTTEMGEFYRFETVTLAPFDKNAIDFEQMSDREKALFEAYQQKVYETLSPFLKEEEKTWLFDQKSIVTAH